MVVDLEEQKRKVEIQKKKIKLREILLREKERQREFKRISEVVRLAFKMQIDQIEDTILLGAFLEISEKMQNPKNLEDWKKKGQTHLESEEKVQKTPEILIAITFNDDPGDEIKESLKKMRFRWNSFRKEFCGHADPKELENILKGSDFHMEIIE